jgi:hypothetical protein
LKYRKHIESITTKANRLLAVVRRGVSLLHPEILKPIFTTIIRSFLAYGGPVWNPSDRGSIDKIERVQRRATKMTEGFKELDYQQRLVELNLPTLKYRRMRGDIIQMYKMIRSCERDEFYIGARLTEGRPFG